MHDLPGGELWSICARLPLLLCCFICAPLVNVIGNRSYTDEETGATNSTTNCTPKDSCILDVAATVLVLINWSWS